MGMQVKVPLGDKVVDGEEIEFVAESENWNSYKLEDGTILKMKLVVSQVIRTNEYNKRNEPIYIISSQNVVAPKVPEELKRKNNGIDSTSRS